MSDGEDHRVVLVGMSVRVAVADQAMARLAGDVASELLHARARARDAAGWVMDGYLLRRSR